MVDDFKVSALDNVVTLDLSWGITGIDRSTGDKWDPDDFGSTIYDDEFDISSAEAQQFILDTCESVPGDWLAADASTSIHCFIRDYASHREQLGLDFPAIFSSDATEQRSAFESDLREWYFEEASTTLKNGKVVNIKYLMLPKAVCRGCVL